MDKKYSKEEIYEKIKTTLIDDFEISESLIKPEARMFEDLDFDSIDAIDLAVRLQRYTDKKLPAEKFKSIRTIQDIVDAVYELI